MTEASRSAPDRGRPPLRAGVAATLLAALALTLANAAKPLVVDDTAYYLFARHLAAEPFDPYGFDLLWYESRIPAMRVLAPPLLPTWWGATIRVVGDHPLLWKLGLFPFAWMLALALQRLLRRFAPGLEGPLLWMTLLSPSLLPSFNLMLDVPALALSLAALAVFLDACDARRVPGAILAGLLLGLALETKYTAFVTGGALAAWTVFAREWRLALWAGAAAAAVFAAWEGSFVARYGTSHFWLHTLEAFSSVRATGEPLAKALGFVSLLGAAGAAAGALALVALGARPRSLPLALGVATAAFAAVPFLPAPELPGIVLAPRLDARQPELFVFLPLGVGVLAAAAALVGRLLRGVSDPGARNARFLVVWLAIELAGAWLTSPFLALRRVIGPLLVLTLAAGAEAARGGAAPRSVRVRGVAAWGVALGLLFAVTDYTDATTRRRAARAVAERLEALGADPTREVRWFAGHWGFRFYAEREGLRPMVPGETRLRAGDWLVLPEGVSAQHVRAQGAFLRKSRFAGTVEVANPWPWSTIPSAYAGPLAIRAQPQLQIRARLFRIRADFVP